MKNYDGERSEKLLKLYSGAITDIMDSISPDYRNQTLPSDLRPLTPNMKVAGPVSVSYTHLTLPTKRIV